MLVENELFGILFGILDRIFHMAYIRKHKNGWQVQVALLGIRSSKKFDSEADAKQWAAKAEATIRQRRRARDLCWSGAPVEPKLISAIPARVITALSAIPFSSEVIIDAATPCSSLSGIYFLIAGGEVRYVGQSRDVLKRISRHMHDGRAFDAYTFISCPVADLDRMEMMYITALLPEWNISLRGQGS